MMLASCGTPAYVAPEVLSKQGYSKEVDIWSLGVVLYTMVFRDLPFYSEDRKETFKLIKEKEVDLNVPTSQPITNDLKDLIQKMLKKNPKERISISEAMNHSAFSIYGGPKALSNKLREYYLTQQSTSKLEVKKQTSDISSQDYAV
mmetsp:Transcript_18019/g.13049  ORF Transcript_18019/g.13049 Transcript_18019/m.13049 type:complete len:146 (+) Transcript_18019:258-695(+)